MNMEQVSQNEKKCRFRLEGRCSIQLSYGRSRTYEHFARFPFRGKLDCPLDWICPSGRTPASASLAAHVSSPPRAIGFVADQAFDVPPAVQDASPWTVARGLNPVFPKPHCCRP